MRSSFPLELRADDLSRLAREQQPGKPLGEYFIWGLGRSWRIRSLRMACSFVPEFVLSLILALFSAFHAFSISVFLLFSLFWAPLYMLISLHPPFFGNREYKLCIYDEGCIFQKPKKMCRVIRWRDIEHIWCTAAHPPESRFRISLIYTFQSYDGSILRFCAKTSVLRGADLQIDKCYIQRRLPAYLRDYQAGHSLRFGPLRLNLDGITIGERTHTWEQVAVISLQKQRWLTISTIDGQQTSCLQSAANTIPDLSILLALLAHLHLAQAKPPAPTTLYSGS